MKKMMLINFVLFVCVGWCSAQTTSSITQQWTANSTTPEKHSLQCGQYQHKQKIPAHCVNTCDPEGTACTTQCLYVESTDQCVDDMHVVTEREWQQILVRLAFLEERK